MACVRASRPPQALLSAHEAALTQHFLRSATRAGTNVRTPFVSAATFVQQLQPITRPVRVPPPPELDGTVPEVLLLRFTQP